MDLQGKDCTDGEIWQSKKDQENAAEEAQLCCPISNFWATRAISVSIQNPLLVNEAIAEVPTCKLFFKLTIAHIEQTQCFSAQRQQKGFSLDQSPCWRWSRKCSNFYLKPQDLHVKVLSSSQAKQTLYFSWVLRKTEAHKTQALLQTTRLLLHITQKQKRSFSWIPATKTKQK